MLGRIIFSHGNSFPGGTYRLVLESLRQRGFEVQAIDKFGHDPQYPVTDNWPHLVQQLADFASSLQNAGPPAFLVGHSLGGILSLMCAALHPELARGVLLLDSPILGGWKATTLGLAKRTQLVGALSPGQLSKKRRNHWPDREAALASLHGRGIFKGWTDAALRAYVEHAIGDCGEAVVLKCRPSREVEIFSSFPKRMWASLAAIRTPTRVLYGEHTYHFVPHSVNRLVALNPKVSGRQVAGGHCFMQEHPEACAKQVQAFLLQGPAG